MFSILFYYNSEKQADLVTHDENLILLLLGMSCAT